jgi:general secretion pathway protein I
LATRVKLGPPPSRGRTRSAKRGAGFTLVEVVVAFLLLSLVLATGFELFTTGMRRAIDIEERSQALVVAQSQLATAGVEQQLKEGSASGQTDDGKFRWITTIARSQEGEAEANQPMQTAYGLYRVEVVVSWRGADERDQTFSLATLQLGSVL